MTRLNQIDVRIRCDECGPVAHPLYPDEPNVRVTGTDLLAADNDRAELWFQVAEAWRKHLADHEARV